MKYPEIAIKALINTIGDDEEAYKWLTESQYKELAAFYDVLYFGDESAANYLLKNKDKYPTIINFLAALNSEEKAFNLLMVNDKEWAATVSAVHGSKQAYEWLVNNNFAIYVDLTDELIKYAPTRRGSGINGYSSFEAGVSDDGFAGFGGGDFGGGGGGGKW
jgi:uncharacterized membrane protein YgcG